MVCRLKPPMKEPQGILAVLSRSPIVLTFGKLPWAVVGLEHKSPVGSISPIMVIPPLPSSIRLPVVMEFVFVTLLVWPANILSAPGVDGPYWSAQELSLI